MKYNICYKLDNWAEFGNLIIHEDEKISVIVTEEQLETLLQAIKSKKFNDKKVKKYNNKKHYSLYVFEDSYYNENNYHDLDSINTWALVNGYF